MATDEQTSTELWARGAGELAAAIAAREVSSREVVEAHIARIETVNPQVNAIHVVLADEALAAADVADAQTARGESAGALHGVPVSIKENVDVAGTATTWGVAAMAQAISPLDAPAVAHLRAAGAIPLIRGNLPEFALRWHTDNDLMGATINPWDPNRTPGASSGGEAVALATGMTPLAMGNDLGGSLRWPAQCTGTVGLRPTQGRIADASLIPPSEGPISIQLLSVQGPMAREVADLRLALEIMSRPSARDGWYVPAPLTGPALPGPIAVDVSIPDGTSPEVAEGVRRAARALDAAGYAVSEAMAPGVDEAAQLWADLLINDIRRIWPMMSPVVSEASNRFIGFAFEIVDALDGDAYAARWPARQVLARTWAGYQATRPLVLAPVFMRTPFGPQADTESRERVAEIVDAMKMVVTVNLLGVPAVAVGAGVDDHGLPLGVQIIGPRFREDLCLDAAEVVEAALGTIVPIDPVSAR